MHHETRKEGRSNGNCARPGNRRETGFGECADLDQHKHTDVTGEHKYKKMTKSYARQTLRTNNNNNPNCNARHDRNTERYTLSKEQ